MFGPGRAEAGPGRAEPGHAPGQGRAEAGDGRSALPKARVDARRARAKAGRRSGGDRRVVLGALVLAAAEVLIPSVLTRCDTPDRGDPRTVVLVNPASAMGQPEREAQMRGALWLALDAEKRLRTRNRIRIARRALRRSRPDRPARVSKITTCWRRGARCSRRSRGRRDGSPATARTWRRFANRNASEVPAWRSGRASDSWPTSAAAPSCWG